MNDELMRMERIHHAIEECVGVFKALDLNMAESAYVCKCLEEGAKAIVNGSIEKAKDKWR